MHFTAIEFILVLFALRILRKLLMIQVAFYVFCKSELLKRYRVYKCPHGDGQIESEIRACLGLLPLDILLVGGTHYMGWIKSGPTTLLTTAYSFALMFVWFEVWFYVTHRLLHLPAFYFIHAQHHTAKVTSPWSAFSFSYMERFILVGGAMGFAVVCSHILPITIAGFALYFLANNIMNILLHSNVELFPSWFVQGPLGRWIFTPTYHAMHHARYNGHYGLFTQILDRACQTVWNDYEKVQERASQGNGLESLGKRLPVDRSALDVVPVAITNEPVWDPPYPSSLTQKSSPPL